MNEAKSANRRTVLKTIPAALVGGSIVTGTAGATREGVRGGANDGANEVEIVAEHDHEADEHAFEFSSTEISSGWTTITLDNRTDHTHFAYLAKVPQDAIAGAEEDGEDLLDYYVEHVTRPFQWFMDDIDPEREPDPDDLSDKYSNLDEEVVFPGWFEAVLPSGGPGLTSGETTSTTTVNLDPGEYIVECYVKTEDGEFHSYLGMIDLLTVTDDQSDAAEPEGTLDLSLSTAGIDFEEEVRSGEHTVAVQVEDQQVYDHLLGHDVHLIRFDDETTTADVNGWTNWMDPTQLVSDGTEPGTFVGGTQTILTPELLEGGTTETAYVHVDLDPGAYAWVSEVPDPAGNGMLETFTVPFD
jgi:hypothetical protein